MTDESGFTRDSIIARAKGILTEPAKEWPRIEAEPQTIIDILKSYSIPLAAIGPICQFLASQIFGFRFFGLPYRPSLTASSSIALMSFAMVLLGLFVLSFIVGFLAPKFGGAADRTKAFKLVAYSMTAAALAGIFGLIPALGWLSIVGLYSLYLFHAGVTRLMNVPQDKAMIFTAMTLLCAVALYAVGGSVVGSFSNLLVRPALPDLGAVAGSVTVPGVGTIDMDKVNQAAQQVKSLANSGRVKPIDVAALQAMLPPGIGGFARMSAESTGLGIGGSNAEARYEKGAQHFDLSVTDMAAMGAVSSLGATMGVQASNEDADSYERTLAIDGEMVSEKWNHTDKSGEYGTTVANRFMIKAEGNVDDIGVLKHAVAEIDTNRLKSMLE
jgi:hypothetical protein